MFQASGSEEVESVASGGWDSVLASDSVDIHLDIKTWQVSNFLETDSNIIRYMTALAKVPGPQLMGSTVLSVFLVLNLTESP